MYLELYRKVFFSIKFSDFINIDVVYEVMHGSKIQNSKFRRAKIIK